jgi:hypothetical protein
MHTTPERAAKPTSMTTRQARSPTTQAQSIVTEEPDILASEDDSPDDMQESGEIAEDICASSSSSVSRASSPALEFDDDV